MSTYLKEYDDAMLQAAVTAYGATSMRGELALLALDRGRRLTEAGEQLAWLLEKLQELKCEVSELISSKCNITIIFFFTLFWPHIRLNTTNF